MKKRIIVGSLLAGLGGMAPLHAQTTWFNVLGDPHDANVNTIEVDPVPVAVNGELKTMKIRVSRSEQRKSWDGVPYRSYTSTVVFDCAHKSARYVSLDFYMEPAWKGASHKTSTFTPEVKRPMEFRDVTPNPTQRLVRAACRTTVAKK
ncbi:hypothetical protein SAMN05216350_101355 [Polaromonas sp. YR568]|uniref:surface-adhesin E family protein n=1 Tax=Polaromonas sp. YR568 TaxID=1855301 RepID=UPI0008E34D41|nr:surface-adhesin E family protein [Polaromonas sp. YR568]SFU33030.1 hypothetical protein SAMN05216350_101355 [Polaromonas sp. YR568]